MSAQQQDESSPAHIGPQPAVVPRAVATQLDDLVRLADGTRRVSFTHLAQIRRIREQVASVGERAGTAESTLLERFETAEGHIRMSYGCRRLLGGAALVDVKDSPLLQLFTVCNTDDSRLVAIETRSHEVLDQVNEIAGRSVPLVVPARNTATALYSVMTEVLDASDLRVRLHASGRTPTKEESNTYEAVVASAAADLAAADRRATVIAERWTRGVYLSGVALGTLLTLILVAGVGGLLATFWPTVLASAPLVTAGVFGTLGAVVSVFQRISTGRLTLDVTASPLELRSLALLRPLVGAVFGAVAELALGAGLLSVTSAGASNATIGSFAVIGFVAGFSERFAIDAVERAGRVLSHDDATTAGAAADGAAKGGGATLAAVRTPAPPTT